MKNFTLLIAILNFLSCISDKKTSEFKAKSEKLNTDLIGIYEYKTSEKSENHYIVIDTLNGKYNGIYFGTEDSGGHGVFFYGNQIKNLNLEGENISFEIGTRHLYDTTRFRIIKNKTNLEKETESGISKGNLKYVGKLSENEIQFKCKSEYGDCWEDDLKFIKLEGNN